VLLSYRIDWLAFTDPALLPRSAILDYEWTEPTNKPTVPLRGYNTAMDMRVGRVDWHTERQQQRRLWTLTGSDLTSLINRGFAHETLVSAVCDIIDVSATRLDFAVDVREGKADPSDIENEWRAGRVHTHARKMTVIEATTRGRGKTGKTVYIGSRQSQAFLRIYDKGAEQNTGEDWTRIELETKPPLSTLLLKAMNKDGIMSMGTAAVRRCADVPRVDWYTDALAGAGEVDLRVGRKQTDWEKWVKAVALPNVLKAVEENMPGIREELLRALRSSEQPL
jgi:DNA relaxase NicK